MSVIGDCNINNDRLLLLGEDRREDEGERIHKMLRIFLDGLEVSDEREEGKEGQSFFEDEL